MVFNFSKLLIRSFSVQLFVRKFPKRSWKMPLFNFGGGSSAVRPISTDFEVLEAPEKSESDQKDYRIIRLSNGLKALLIHDPNLKPAESDSDSSVDISDPEADAKTSSSEEEETSDEEDSDADSDDIPEKQAAAALTIDVGSFSDPRDVQGLAHFLEHMIFMGSKKYPKENEYDAYIKRCGGSDNADTDCEETSFYFEVNEENFDGALDRFAQLFVAPLLKREGMTREREAVESEFVSKKQSDSIRKEQLLADLGNPDHPSSIFTWGNLKTLKENIDDSELYQKVNEFRKRHYSAHRMYVALQARLSLDELQTLAIKHFSSIENNKLPGIDFTSHNHRNAFKDEFFNKVIYVKPIANISKLDLTWCLPSYLKDYRTKPQHFLSFILGYEGAGSLCSYLRKKLWALEVIVGNDESGFEHNTMYSLFTTTILLTDDGFANINKVLDATFAYIRLLSKHSLEHIYNELQTIEATTFKFASETDPIDNVEELVVSLKYYPPRDVLTGPHIYYEYDKEIIDQVVRDLNSRCFNVMITKKDMPGIVFDCKEKWFGTEHTMKDFPEEWTKLWESPSDFDELFLPEPNKFIPTDFSILKPPPTLQISPVKVYEADCCELWYKQDVKFLRPKAFMYFYFISPLPGLNVTNSTLLNLYSIILKYQLVDDLYAAEVAGLQYETYSAENGLVLKANGYNEKLYLVVDMITKKMNTFLDRITPEIFETFKRQLSKNYFNMIIKPKSLNKEVRLQLVENVRHTNYEKYNLLESLTLDELRKFGAQFHDEMKIQAVIQGNIGREHAVDVMKNVINNLSCRKINDMSPVYRRTCRIPSGENFIRIKSMNPRDANTMVTNFYQVGPSTIKLTSMLDLLVMLMEEPLFDIVRTKEQFGYDVGCTVRDNYSILGFSIGINSQETKFTAEQVEQRIEQFRGEFLEILLKMPDKEFDQNRDALIKLNLVEDHRLKEEVNRNWAEVTTEEYIFDRREKEVDALRCLTKAEFVEFYRNLVENLEKNRKLSVQVIGTNVSSEEIDEEMEIPNHVSLKFSDVLKSEISNISDIVKFKEKLFVFPVTKTTCDPTDN